MKNLYRQSYNNIIYNSNSHFSLYSMMGDTARVTFLYFNVMILSLQF